MGFVLPLKVFLSYSHDDDPKLFQDFRNQLMALEDDKIIKVWADRDISAGRDWDREIKKSLNECHIFLALTSASFNASGYIRGVEMQTAWERHKAGECRIVPVMWRQWRPPEQLRTLQFLLDDLRQDVANAAKRDDVLYQLIVRLEGVAKEMSKGSWVPRGRVLEPLPVELPYLCDWTAPILRLGSLRKPTGRPAVLILIGTPEDCLNAFLDRTHRGDLPRALDLQTLPLHDMRLMDWPSDPEFVSGFVHQALEAEPEWEIENKLAEGLTLLKTTTSQWNSSREAVLLKMLQEWSGERWMLPATRRLVLVVSIETFRRDASIHKEIEAMIREHQIHIPVSSIALPKIDRDDAVNWVSLPQVRGRCRSDRREDLESGIRAIFKTNGSRSMPMKPLAGGLLRLLEAYRDTGAAG